MADVLSDSAGICGLPSFGTELVINLHKVADNVIHAREQIASIAQHVQDFAMVLQYLARVLETGDEVVPAQLIADLLQLKASCGSMLQNIESLLQCGRSGRFDRIRWAFTRKSKAKELEAKLDSQKTTLQTMIHVVLISWDAVRDPFLTAQFATLTNFRDESQNRVADIKVEVKILEATIISNFCSLTELHNTEQLCKENGARAYERFGESSTNSCSLLLRVDCNMLMPVAISTKIQQAQRAAGS